MDGDSNTVSKPRHSCPRRTCCHCWGFIIRQWCDYCLKVHETGHSYRCLIRNSCDSLLSDCGNYQHVPTREESPEDPMNREGDCMNMAVATRRGMMPEIYEGNTGVYCIRNVKNGKRYVGSTTIDFMKRWRQHQKYLRANRHCNVYLQRAWNKYGSGAFVFQILERCEPTRCTDRETLWIAHLNTVNQGKGYNICKTGRNPLGVKRSDETRAKHRKNWEDPEVRRKASIRMRLVAADPDVHRRVMDAKSRITADPEYRRKMSESLNRHWGDPERKRKHVESLRRQSASPEWRKHVKEAGARRRGIKFSEEHKRKMKEGQYRYLARKKANLDGEQT